MAGAAEVYQGDGELIPSTSKKGASAYRSLSGGRKTDSQPATRVVDRIEKSIRGTEN